jgi:hypothetical protein
MREGIGRVDGRGRAWLAALGLVLGLAGCGGGSTAGEDAAQELAEAGEWASIDGFDKDSAEADALPGPEAEALADADTLPDAAPDAVLDALPDTGPDAEVGPDVGPDTVTPPGVRGGG